jgi:hypothetical protein
VLERILQAGGPAMRAAAEERARRRSSLDLDVLEQTA